INAVVSPSAGFGRAGSGMTYAPGLAATGAEIFARRLALTAFGFAFFTAINGQDVKHETRRRKENYSAKSNFKDFLKPRQIFCAVGGDQRDVFQPHAADFRIVKPRLHGHDLPGLQFAARTCANARRFVDVQAKPMARAVKKSLHASIALASVVAALREKLQDAFMDLRRQTSGAHFLEPDLLPVENGVVKFFDGLARAPAHDGARDVAKVTGLLRSR